MYEFISDSYLCRHCRTRTRRMPDACELQGLPRDFLQHVPWTSQGKLKAIANAVPLPMGRAIAAAVQRAMNVEQAS